ncbi:uncharacterized protein LOC141857445 [Brevipalpus obovatus]|uniref:uncharacterized protein LOC141857445 n=1 Tax=Brevipalpus obovatus TaxID=246614 RepID=UPI003D9E72A8
MGEYGGITLDFLAWKSRMEDDETAHYALKTGKREDKRRYYECNRSGEYKSEGSNIRARRQKDTRKIGKRCPSTIRVHEKDDKIHVTFYRTHVGHQKEMKHISIPQNDRIEIAQQIAGGVSKDRILERIQNTWTETNNKRVHRVQNKDLINITHSFKLDSEVVRHKNDLISVESWIAEMHASDFDPIIIHQDQIEQESQPLILGISNRAQRYMLERFGDDINAMDSTHGTNDYDFQLTTIMVVDENRNGFPVAFCYSSKMDHEVFVKFFEALKSCCNVKTPKVFMTDDCSTYHNAWTEVFGSPENKLLCTWHVMKNWNKHLLKIPDIPLRKQLTADLHVLHNMIKEEEFEKHGQFFISKYQKESATKGFIEYFQSYYWERRKQWALCYRKYLNINTNMLLETFHRILKHVFMAGKKVRRLDKSLHHLTRTMDYYQYQRMIRKEQGFMPPKLSILRRRHERALKSEFIVSQSELSPDEWFVISQSDDGTNTYTVIFPDLECECLLRCEHCNICMKQAKCECFDYCIKGNLCKHIHYIMMNHRGPRRVQSVDDQEEELVIDQVEEQNTETQLMLPTRSYSQSQDILEQKRLLLKQVSDALDLCSTSEQIEAIKNFITPMKPTILSLEKTGTKQISTVTGSQGTSKKIDPQRRFTKVRKKKTRTNDSIVSSLREEFFLSCKANESNE